MGEKTPKKMKGFREWNSFSRERGYIDEKYIKKNFGEGKKVKVAEGISHSQFPERATKQKERKWIEENDLRENLLHSTTAMLSEKAQKRYSNGKKNPQKGGLRLI